MGQAVEVAQERRKVVRVGKDWLKDDTKTWVCSKCHESFSSLEKRKDHALKCSRRAVFRTFEEYEDIVMNFAVYPDKGRNFVYPALGIGGEAGEVVDKVKKILRDKGGELKHEDIEALCLELGDVLWYIVAMAFELGRDLRYVAEVGVEKLLDRNDRGVLHGEGDDR